jgi:SAM-dependent methyltransferase
MSALSQEGTPSPPPEENRLRQVFEYFSGDAALYNRSRPAYPDALIMRIVTAMPGRGILDAGCGTGIEARQFQAAGCTVLGVEPDARMAEFARGTGVAVEVATFETWEAADRTFDAVVAGTAWHWVDPLAGAAKAAQVLRPGGLLAPFHHVTHTPPELAGAAGGALPAWCSRSAEAYRRVAPDSPFNLGGQRRSTMELYQPLFDKIADGIRQASRFSEPEQWRFDWERTYSRDEWLDLLPTQGALTKLPPDKLAEVLDAAGTVIDKMGGSFSMPYTTVAVTAVRRKD